MNEFPQCERQEWNTNTRIRLLQNALEQASDHVIITDRAGAIEYVNPAFEGVTGYRLQDVIGENPRLLKSDTHPQSFYEQLWNTILEGRTYRAVFVNRKKNGQLYREHKSISPIRNEQGEITHFLSVGRDVTDEYQRTMELEFERHKAHFLEEFISSASHDFRTPLTILTLRIYELEKMLDEERGAELLPSMKAQTHYLQHLSENILTFSRLKNKSDWTFTMVDINELIKDVVERNRFLFHVNSVHLHLELDSAQPIILGNAFSLNRMVSNLIENALNHTSGGGTVEIRSCVQGNKVIVTIEDTGSGIDASRLPHIFEQFYHHEGQRPAQKKTGMGLGLSIVKMVVNMHGGEITVNSELGKGTTFVIEFIDETHQANHES